MEISKNDEKKIIKELTNIANDMELQLHTIYDSNKYRYWFYASDFAKIIKYDNVSNALQRHVHAKNKIRYNKIEKYADIPKKNAQPHSYYINAMGIKQILIAMQKTLSVKLSAIFGISIYKLIRKEISIVGDLEAFCERCKIDYSFQHIVKCDDGKKYRIDFYLVDYRIAIEIDEHNHDDRDPQYESNRQKQLEKKLNCTFVRCDPDDPNFSFGDLIGRIHLAIIEFGQPKNLSKLSSKKNRTK
jgi:hypothetical protein